ncbi:MAG: divergent PAP2 family protein [Chitinophagales bacterium]
MQEFLRKIDGNGFEVIVALLAANQLAQIFKTIRVAFSKRKFNLKLLFATGGMPSSHSATVTAMASSVGLVEGFDSTYFAIAACFASVVMVDAAGLRRSASKQAKVLNKMMIEIFTEHKGLQPDRLKEFLGHTPIEVFVGAMLGIGVSLGLHYWLEMLR